MNVFHKTYSPQEYQKLDCNFKDTIIFPKQTHSSNIVEIVTGKEILEDTDGLFTKNQGFVLAIKTADCAPIVMWDDEKFGVFHSGWKGVINGLVENSLTHFNNPNIWVGPFLHKFEIQKDSCYECIFSKYGNRYFENCNNLILFDFKRCVSDLLKNAKFDEGNTFFDKSLASWRRDKTTERNITIVKYVKK